MGVVDQCGDQGRAVLQGALSVVEEEAKVSRQEILAVLEAEIKTRWGSLVMLLHVQRRGSSHNVKITYDGLSSLRDLHQYQ